MKHLTMSKNWVFGPEPFPAFRCSLVYGQNQHDREFIGVNGLSPDETGALGENCFQVVKAKDGQILVTVGNDTTNRCLLFVGCAGGFRGDVKILEEATTGRVLKKCYAGNACESGIEVAALLEVGQTIAFHSRGRHNNDVIVHTWTGTSVNLKTWSKLAWDRRNDPPRSEENVTWMSGAFRVVRLSGDNVTEGIELDEQGNLSPYGRLAHGFKAEPKGTVVCARLGRDIHKELVIAAPRSDESVETKRVLVLVHEYSPGCGAKRWPSFHIDWENAGPVEKIEEVYRGSGSGSDKYTLIIAPPEWAENIAAQFVNARDVGGQTIAYKPAGERMSNTSLASDDSQPIDPTTVNFSKFGGDVRDYGRR